MAAKTNEELNLTPFIGLFAMLVVLLLVTAVWNTTEVLSTNTASSTASSDPNPTPPPKENKPNLDLNVTVLLDKVQVTVNSKPIFFPLINGEIDEVNLVAYMKQLKDLDKDKKDLVLYTDNRIPYRHLIKTFDLLIGAGFPDVGVSTQ